MRALRVVIVIAPLFLAACGSSEKTVVVNPAPNTTTVVHANGDTTVVHHDDN
jgi:hypothetical protein